MTIPLLAALAAVAIFSGAMLIAAAMDLATMRIPNALVLFLLLAYPLLAPFAGIGLAEIAMSAFAAAAILGLGFILFARGWMGGGDIKLAAVTVLWIGFDHTLAYLVYAGLFGGVLTIALLQLRMVPLPAFLQARPQIVHLQTLQAGVPYGIALAGAALAVLPNTSWLAFV